MRVSVFNLNNPIWFTNGDVLEYILPIQFILMYIILIYWGWVLTPLSSIQHLQWVVTRALTRNNLKGSIAIHKCPRQKDLDGWVHLIRFQSSRFPNVLRSERAQKRVLLIPRREGLETVTWDGCTVVVCNISELTLTINELYWHCHSTDRDWW